MLTYDAQRRTKTIATGHPSDLKNAIIKSSQYFTFNFTVFYMLMHGNRNFFSIVLCLFWAERILFVNLLRLFCLYLIVYDSLCFSLICWSTIKVCCFFFLVRLPQAILKYKPVKLKPQRIFWRNMTPYRLWMGYLDIGAIKIRKTQFNLAVGIGCEIV